MSSWRWSRRRFLAGIAASSGATLLAQQGCSTRPGPKSALASDPTQLDLLGASRAIRDRSLSPVEITTACLERIARLDQRLNSFITVTAERAMADAREAEAEVASGHWLRLTLHSTLWAYLTPFGVKLSEHSVFA